MTALYVRGKQGDAATEARTHAGNDTMLAGASIFAAAAILSIVLVMLSEGLSLAGFPLFWMAH